MASTEHKLKTPLDIAVIGTGAVGGYYGARLAQAGHRVHFLLHSDYAHVRDHGLQVTSPRGAIRLATVNAYAATREMPRCDLVIIALKSTANHLLSDLLPPLVQEDAVVLMLENGLGVEAEAAAVAGHATILGGLCFLCSRKIGPGRIEHQDYGQITLGEFRAAGAAAGITPLVAHIGATLEGAGIPVRPEPDLARARWIKLIWNMPYNGLTVVLNTDTGAIMSEPHTAALARTMMEEVVSAGSACTRPIPATLVDTMLENTRKMVPYAPSMKLDWERGHPLEIEAIYTRPLAAAKAAGIPMPTLSMLHDELRFMATSR